MENAGRSMTDGKEKREMKRKSIRFIALQEEWDAMIPSCSAYLILDVRWIFTTFYSLSKNTLLGN